MAKTRKQHEDPVMDKVLKSIKSKEKRDFQLSNSRRHARTERLRQTYRTDFTVQKPFLWKKADRNGAQETEDPGLGN